MSAVLKATNPKDAVGVRKVPFHVIPRRVMGEVGLALLEGARKYGAYNWRAAGVRASVYVDAVERHLSDFWEGVDTDPDSGLSHVTKAIASLTVLRDGMLHGNWEDDRPIRVAHPWLAEQNKLAGEIIDRHPVSKEGFTERGAEKVVSLKPWQPKTNGEALFALGLKNSIRRAPPPAPVQAVGGNSKVKVYLAGPMRNIDNFNYPAFAAAARDLRERGYFVFNPAEVDSKRTGTDASQTADGKKGVLGDFDLRAALAEDTRFICQEADAIALLPGWRNSKGAVAEHSLAVALGLEVIYIEGKEPTFNA